VTARKTARTATRITQQELESYLWGAAVLLRGLIDAGDYKQFIFPLLFFKRVSDVYDEEYEAALAESGGDLDYAAFAENHRFQIPNGAHWRDVREAARDVGRAIQDAMRAIEAANPGRLDGIFGDAQWTNKERLPDATLKNLVEHFSSRTLSVANVPEDELGNAYEFLIKKFADDSGHTAAEFYTNRTVVHLMTRLLDPQPSESIYDPTCGTGGMLLSALAEVKRQGGEYRTLKLCGQERNLMTSAIARMNLFLHGVEDFAIARGDTLAEPKLLEGDRLRRFDVILANPPYSIKQWNRQAFASDPYRRNILGTPPQGRADYAFWQHILASLGERDGRCAILFPHGVLFRNEEREMREKLVASDMIEAVIGLGPNLFYNSPMEACVVVCRTKKARTRRGRVLFVDAMSEVTREQGQSFLTPANQERILAAYRAFSEEPGFAAVATLASIKQQKYSLNIALFVERDQRPTDARSASVLSTSANWEEWDRTASGFWRSLSGLLARLTGGGDAEEVSDVS
jgi:type I restriction enzyme M protein